MIQILYTVLYQILLNCHKIPLTYSKYLRESFHRPRSLQPDHTRYCTGLSPAAKWTPDTIRGRNRGKNRRMRHKETGERKKKEAKHTQDKGERKDKNKTQNQEKGKRIRTRQNTKKLQRKKNLVIKRQEK